MRLKSTALLASCLYLAACDRGETDPAAVAKNTPSAESSAQAEIYRQIRKLTANGDLAGAAKLTDNPAAYQTRMETAKQAMDDGAFASKMAQAADHQMEALREKAPYSMLVVQFDQQGTMERAVTFFRQTNDGLKEIIDPNEDIPCQLVRDFYEIKGEKDGEVKNCTEDKADAES